MNSIEKMQCIATAVVAVALLVCASMITIAIAASVNHAADKLEPEPEKTPGYTKEFISTLDLNAGTVYVEGGGSVSYAISDRVSQSSGMLVIYRPGTSTTYYVPIDHITRIQVGS
jgi:hypothetical protein